MGQTKKSAEFLLQELEAAKAHRNQKTQVLLPPQHVGDGDASQTTWEVTQGFKPWAVYKGGLMQIEAADGTEDYHVSFDGFTYSVVFEAAPGAGVAVQIVRERV